MQAEHKGTSPAWEVVYQYLLESQKGHLTKGMASLPVDLLTIVTGQRLVELKKTLRSMEADNLVVIHQIDATAVDLAVTAVGMARYIARVDQ
jgi:hypothetical protein